MTDRAPPTDRSAAAACAARPSRWIRAGSWAVIITAVALRLFVYAPLSTYPQHLDVDDLLYLESAYWLTNGSWLGPYDAYRLTKSPGYPLFLAGNHILGFSRRMGEELITIVAGLIALGSLRRLGVRRDLSLVTFVMLLQSPGLASTSIYRVLRENLYGPLLLMVVAFGLAVLGSKTRLMASLTSLGLGVATAWAWMTREEGVALVPYLAGLGALILLRERRRTGRWWAGVGAVVVALGIPAVLVVGSVFGFRELNLEHYGTRVGVELEDPAFVDAVSALNRVAASHWQRWEPLDRDLLERAYTVSPTLASLRGVLDSNAYAGPGCLAGNGQRTAIYRMWTLRLAAASKGHHESPSKARAFYRALADEIQRGIDDRVLPTGPRTRSIVPKMHSQIWGLLGEKFWTRLRSVWKLEVSAARQGSLEVRAQLPPERAERFQQLLDEPPRTAIGPSTRTRHAWMNVLEPAAARLTRWLHWAGLVGFALALSRRESRTLPIVGSVAAIVLFVVARVFMVAFIETYWWDHAINYLYCVYPVASLAAAIGLHGGITALRHLPGIRSIALRLPLERVVAPTAIFGVCVAFTFSEYESMRRDWLRAAIPVRNHGALLGSNRPVGLATVPVVVDPRGDLCFDRDRVGPVTFQVMGHAHPSDVFVEGEFPASPSAEPWTAHWTAERQSGTESFVVPTSGPGKYRVAVGVRGDIRISLVGPVGGGTLRIHGFQVQPTQ